MTVEKEEEKEQEEKKTPRRKEKTMEMRANPRQQTAEANTSVVCAGSRKRGINVLVL